MNFFESQDAARRRTGRLVVLFALAVIAIAVLAHLVIVTGLALGGFGWSLAANPLMFAGAACATLIIIGGGSLARTTSLRFGGGIGVAERVGGRLLLAGTESLPERKVLNVVEEMAIASGTPVPPVYMLDGEPAINAFAAGYTPSDAVIGVSRGCAERLTRDELQGVIAHEFSHILNGDMRLNIRLIGILHGILMLGILGHVLLRSSIYAGGGRRSSRDGGSAVVAIVAVGAGLTALGFVGTFFGDWIKAAVSRQREYLADASAVQFTRNPSGIAGALRKIGGSPRGARIRNPKAEEASHLFFGAAFTSGLAFLFSTHPPLDERIRRIDPSWDGTFLTSEPESATSPPPPPPPSGTDARRRAAVGLVGTSAAMRSLDAIADLRTSRAERVAAAAEPLIERIGRPTPEHVAYARELIGRLPPAIVTAAHEPHGARAVVLSLLLEPDGELRAGQLDQLRAAAAPDVRAELARLMGPIAALERELRLPLMELAIGGLTAMSRSQYETFRANVIELCRADDRIDVFEWCVQRIVLGHLDRRFGRASPRRTQYYALARLGPACGELLSTLAHAGHAGGESRAAFDHGCAAIPEVVVPFVAREACSLDRLDRALAQLALLAPRPKGALIQACAACVAADREVTASEAELLRAIAEALDCPMPPLLPGQSLV